VYNIGMESKNKEVIDESIKPMSAEELSQIIIDFKETLNKTENGHSDEPFVFQEKKRLCQEFIQTLIDQKEKFAHIFKTFNDSTYFVLADGKSFRIRSREHGYELRPIMEKIVFRSDPDILNHIDNDQNIAKGLIPIEQEIDESGNLKEVHYGQSIFDIIK